MPHIQPYIQEKVEEAMKDFCLEGKITEGHATAIKGILTGLMNDLLLKCKEAVGEEFEEPKDGGQTKVDAAIYAFARGHNSCRSTTLQNLDNLK